MILTQEQSPSPITSCPEKAAIEDRDMIPLEGATVGEILDGFESHVDDDKAILPRNRNMSKFVLHFVRKMSPDVVPNGDNYTFVVQSLLSTNCHSDLIGGSVEDERRGGDAEDIIVAWDKQISEQGFVSLPRQDDSVSE
jgi:hypothetical protein